MKTLTRALLFSIGLTAVLFVLPMPAFADAAADVSTVVDIGQIWDYVRDHNWLPLMSLGIVLVTGLWTKEEQLLATVLSEHVRAWIALGLSVAGTSVQGLAKGVPWTQVVFNALTVAMMAIGTNHMLLGGKPLFVVKNAAPPPSGPSRGLTFNSSDPDATPPEGKRPGSSVGLRILVASVVLGVSGLAAAGCAAALPIIHEAATILAEVTAANDEAANKLASLEKDAELFFLIHPSPEAQAKVAKAFKLCREGLVLANDIAADAKTLDQAKWDEAYAAFRKSWADLSAAFDELGIGVGGAPAKIGAARAQTPPRALTHKVGA